MTLLSKLLKTTGGEYGGPRHGESRGPSRGEYGGPNSIYSGELSWPSTHRHLAPVILNIPGEIGSDFDLEARNGPDCCIQYSTL